MGRLSSIGRLPAGVRAELEQQLIASNFTGYEKLVAGLRERGYAKVSKSALHRHGKAMERRIQAARAAAQLQAAGIDADMAAELTGDATLVVVIDRRNGRARLISLPMAAAAVIGQIKKLKQAMGEME